MRRKRKESQVLNLEEKEQGQLLLGKRNVAAILNSSQNVVATYTYDPFGVLMQKTGTLNQPYMFSTKEYDTETGLSYYGYRFYSPAIGRWITRDPIEEEGGINLYGFAGNNPINFTDPMGLAVVSWPIPKCEPIGPSEQNCSVYKVDCDKGDITACLLYQACLNLGDNRWSNCVRCCLQEKYRECNKCGCIIVDHFDCWISCPPVFR